MTTFEEFHIAGSRETSARVATAMRAAGIRLQERVSIETARPDYVIAVHTEDLERAVEVFQRGVGLGRTFTSGAEPNAEAVITANRE